MRAGLVPQWMFGIVWRHLLVVTLGVGEPVVAGLVPYGCWNKLSGLG
jgi:hypothetical protein